MDQSERIPIDPYRPSNGTEGRCFQEHFCCRCVKDRAAVQEQRFEDGCPILAATYVFSVGEAGYPGEWISVGGEPQCTAFVEDVGQKWPADATPYELEAAGQQRLVP